MTVQIRKARPEDIPALITLATETFVDSFGHYHTPENCAKFVAQTHNAAIYNEAITNPKALVLIANNDGTFLAYLFAKPADLPLPDDLIKAHELSKIYTRKSAQGEGLGTRLLLEWEGWAGHCGFRDLVLGVWSENIDAQRFYARYGYKKISDYKLTVGDVQDTDYIFHKTL